MGRGTVSIGHPMRARVHGILATIRVWGGETWIPVDEPEAVEPVEPTDPDTLVNLAQIADQCAWWRTSTSTGPTGTTIISRHTVQSPAKSLRARWGVHGWGGMDAGMTGSAAFVVRGVPHWLTFDGEPTVTIPRLDFVTSDPLPASVTVEAGETIYVVWEAPAGVSVPSGAHKQATPATLRVPGPYPGAPGAMNDPVISGAPQGIYGLTVEDETASIALVGDSFLEAGWGKGALTTVGGFAWTDISQWAEGTPVGDIAGRLSMSEPSPFKTIVTAYGGNNSTQPLADQQETHIAHWRALAGTGAQVAAMTLHPYTSTTDGWTTTEGQAHVPERREADRTARNDWLRDGAPLDTSTWEPYVTGSTDAGAVRIGEPGHPVTFPVFDQADACETARNSGIWKVDGGAWTVDGAHLAPHGSAMLQPHFEAWVRANLT